MPRDLFSGRFFVLDGLRLDMVYPRRCTQLAIDPMIDMVYPRRYTQLVSDPIIDMK